MYVISCNDSGARGRRQKLEVASQVRRRDDEGEGLDYGGQASGLLGCRGGGESDRQTDSSCAFWDNGQASRITQHITRPPVGLFLQAKAVAALRTNEV